ncbi:hypothetical protein [Fusibacter sp. 3D3]|uniref:hypothetical protein n=1 Tax=Fusibacter sp. 3D3 TaxID=1048380 RepID=UPI000853EB42|nr:hypothetical protein [Fusibacter sp. 3D3]GAU79968.1 hypothetical protein F3D3_4633 [Fusibacter sp. 3D3]
MKRLNLETFIANKVYREEKYQYVLLYYFDRIIFEPIESISEISLEYLIQGWVFGPKHQIQIYKDHSGLNAFEFDAKRDGENFLMTEEQILDSRFKHLGKAIVVNKYYVKDEDGQVFMDYQQLVDVVR